MTWPAAAEDPGRTVDWGRTSADYAAHRPGPPDSFFDRLRALGVAPPGSRVLDLGTGTGVIARGWARRGCRCVGVDVSAEQIAAARRLADEERLDAAFSVAPAEATGQPAASFDVVTASQCWLYFDRDRAVAEVRRVLAPGGVLVTSHLSWLPREDAIARRTEALVLRHNPAWTAAGFDGSVPPEPPWIGDALEVVSWFAYDEPIPFTHESWRGRIRACRGVGASMTPDEVARFDRDHERLLAETAPESFAVLHRIDAHVLRPRRPPDPRAGTSAAVPRPPR